MTTPVLEARGLTRSFGQVTALDGADFDVLPGEVVALIGDNGAGKSTLVKALSGNLAVDAGEIRYDGRPISIDTPADASALGIETVHQDLALAPHLDPVQNMFLGRETMRAGLLGHLGFMDNAGMRAEARAAFDDLGATVRSYTSPIGAMSGGQRQAVAIARAVHWASKVVFLDEPTAALGVRQTANVLDTIRRVSDRGVGVVFISHSMPHVIEVADRVHVLRMGRRVATYQAKETSMEQLVAAMTGALGDGGMTTQMTQPAAAPSVLSDESLSLPARIVRLQAFQILLVLIAIVLVFLTLAPHNFGNVDNFRLLSQNAAILAVLGVGMTFVIITSGIDLSIGSVLVFSGVVAAKVMIAMGPADGTGGQGWGVALVGLVVAVAAGLAWGVLNGVLIAKAKLPPLIVTLGTLGAALGLAQVMTKGIDLRTVPTVMQDSIGYGNLVGRLPVIVGIAAAVAVIGGVVLHLTRFGRYTYAVGSNEEAARRVGVRVDRHLILVYALSGLLAGFAGWLSLAQFGTTAIAGQTQTNLNVIAAVVIGGTSLFGGLGSIFGTMVGLFIPAVLQNGFVIVGVQPFWQQVAVGAVLIGAVYIDQTRRAAALRGGAASRFRRRSPGDSSTTSTNPSSRSSTEELTGEQGDRK